MSFKIKHLVYQVIIFHYIYKCKRRMVESKMCIGRTQHVRRPIVRITTWRSGDSVLKFTFWIKLYTFRTVPLSIIRSFSLYTQQNLYDIYLCCEKQKYSNLTIPQTCAYFRSVAGEWYSVTHSSTKPSDHKLIKFPRNTENAQTCSEMYCLGLQVSHIDSRHSFPNIFIYFM